MGNSRSKTLLSIGFMLAGEMALPLIALSLRFFIVAVIDGNYATVLVAAGCVALAWIAQLTFWHFGYRIYFDLLDLNIISFDQELIRLINGSPLISHLERPSFANKFELLRGDAGSLYWAFTGLVQSVGLTLQVGLTCALLTWLAPGLLIVPLFAIPALLAGRWAERSIERQREHTAERRRLGRHILQLLTSGSAAKEVRVFGLQRHLPERSSRLWKETSAELWRGEARGMALRIAGQAIFALAYAGALVLLVSRAIYGQATLGDVVLVVALTGQINQQLSRVLHHVSSLQNMTRAVRRYRWLQAEVAPDRGMPDVALDPPERVERGIELRNVSFTYPEASRPALTDVSLVLPAGSVIGLVGENGSGKTTLVKLLARLYLPDAGAILIDGRDLSHMDADAWRRKISTGFQDFIRFELVARESVGVGDLPRIDQEPAVRTALGKADAQSLMSSLPAGLATQLGKSYAKGRELSAGEWQKVALGRTMMRENPLLLILDEPTASLDAHSEHLLFERYTQQARRIARAQGGICVLISHRFSTVQMADQIVVLEDGKIVEAGSHNTLMKHDGLYADLYRLQGAGYR
jgi:ATP-binding cassette subfamily B protein